MKTYYIHKLTKYETSPEKRGKLIYVSKKNAVLPYLSSTTLNDTLMISILPLYLNDPIWTYRPYTYNNGSQLNVNTRDEYRIYINNSLDNNNSFLNLDDIIVLVRNEESDTKYYLDCINQLNKDEYTHLESILQCNSIGGQHANFEGNIVFIDEKISKYQEESQIEIDSDILDNIPQDMYDTIIKSQSAFRDFVLVGYDHTCAIKGSVIKYNNLNNLEAAHIIPKANGGSYNPKNGICMSREMHWAYDNGFFKIEGDNGIYHIVVHPEINSPELIQYNNQRLHVPSSNAFLPKQEFLDYHNNIIYGKFLNS